MAGNNVSINQGLEFINKYLKDLGIDKNVTSSDVASIFKDLEKNEDGTVETSAFALAVANTYGDEQITTLEDEYLEAWEAFAGMDGDNQSISSEDLSSMNTEVLNNAAAQSDANAAALADRSGGSIPTPGGSNGDNPNGTKSKVEPLSLSGTESLADLQAGRSEAMTALSNTRAQKNSNQDLAPFKDAVDDKKEAYDDAVENISSDDEEIQAQIDDIKERKSANDGAVTSQQKVINDFYDSIAAQESIISSVQSSLSSLQEPNKEDFKEDDGEGNFTYPGYDEAVAEYERQKAELEEQLQSAEDTLAGLNIELSNAEVTLTSLEQEGIGIEQELNTLLTSEDASKINNASQLQQALTDYQTAKTELDNKEQEVNAQYDADIAQLEENIKLYTAAIDEAKAFQEMEEDDDYLNIDEAEEDTDAPRDEETGVLEDLPPEYKDDPRIKVDENGNYYVEVEPFDANDPSSNGYLYNIIKNSYDFDELGVSFDEVKDELLNAIVEANDISDPNVIQTQQRINLVDPYKALGLDNPNDIEDPEGDNTPTEEDKLTLSEEEVAEVVDSLINGTKDEDGNRLSANDVWKNTDFSQLSSETLVQIMNKYNESGKDFFDKANKVFNDTNDANDTTQFNAIVDSLVAQSAKDQQVLSTLNSEVSKAIEEGDTRLLDSLFASSDSHLSELKAFIAQYDENLGGDAPITLTDAINNSENLSEEQKAAYNNLIVETENALEISDEDKALIDALSSDDETVAYEAWKDFASKLDDADPEEITRIAKEYDAIVGQDGAFLEKAKERYSTTYYDTLMDNIDAGYGDQVIDENTTLSTGVNAQEFAESLKSDTDNWNEEVLSSLTSADIAIIAELYGIDEFKSDAADAFGLSNYSKLNEKILDSYYLPDGDDSLYGVSDPKAVEYLEQLTEKVDAYNELKDSNLDLSSTVDEVKDILQNALADTEISVKDRMYIMQQIAVDMPDVVQDLILNDYKSGNIFIGMLDEIARSETLGANDLLWDPQTYGLTGPYAQYLTANSEDGTEGQSTSIMLNGIQYSLDELSEIIDIEDYKNIALIQYATLFEQLSGENISDYVVNKNFENSNSGQSVKYTNALVEMYKDTTPQQQVLLNQIFNTGSTIQYLLSYDTETECFEKLFTYYGNNLPEDASEYGLDNPSIIEIYKDNYLSSGSNVDKLKNILDTYRNNPSDLPGNVAKYLIKELCGGDMSVLTGIFRDISGGFFGLDKTVQEEYLPILSEILCSDMS